MESNKKGTLVSRKVSYEDSNKDLYETPIEITEMLLNRLDLESNAFVLEPANGLGAISRVIKSYGYKCKIADIRDGEDFFDMVDSPQFDAVITNPPYKYAQEFIEKALRQVKVNGKVAMLLRLSFLESKGRYHFFRDSGLKTVYISCKRITMFPFGEEKPKNKGTLAYAWFVWEKGYRGSPEIEWFNY